MFNDNIAMLRTINGYSQEEIAEKLGISRQAYAKWEKGGSVPDVEKTALLAEIYGTTIDGLYYADTLPDGTKILPGPKGKHIFGLATINDKGQIVIPKKARDIFDLKSGDELLILGDDNQGIALVKPDVFEENMRRTLASIT